ncbi:Regulator of nonsense transcripts 1 [Apiospora arundinis]
MLMKGCRRAIPAGDHAQLHPTVQPVTAALGYNVSLFERLYTRCRDDTKKEILMSSAASGRVC